ncbi:MAG: serine hydrolase domain-containing protein [Pseudomonadales bacterium]
MVNIKRVREVAAGLREEQNLPGLVIGLANGDGPLLSEGFGFADVEYTIAQSPNIRHRIGSVTKTMTALCVMALVEEGRLSLDDCIKDLLPDLILHGHGDELSVRHLLLHTGGVGEVPNRELVPRADEIIRSVERRSVSMSELYPDGLEIEVAPGTKWSYSNHGYGLLGEVLSRLEGAALNDVMGKRIFEPLEMEDSDVLDNHDAGLSRCYVRNPGAGLENLPLTDFFHICGDSLRAAGGGQSTMQDMLQFASALLRDGGGIVSRDTYQHMIEPHWCPDPRLTSQAFGFRRCRRFGRSALAHAGGMQGWGTMLTVVPSDDVALVTFTNLTSADFRSIDSALLQAALDAPESTRPDIPIDRLVYAQAPGTYECLPGLLTNLRVMHDQGRVFIEQHGEGLRMRSQRGPWRSGVHIRPADEADPTIFYVDVDGPERAHIVFARDGESRISGIRTDGIVELVRTPD